MLLCLFCFFSVGEGMGEGGALSVAREGRVPRVASVAVEAVRRVDALSQEAFDVAAGAPGDRNAFAISLEAGVKARGDRHRALRVRAPRSSLTYGDLGVFETADAATMPSRNDAIAAPATRPLKDFLAGAMGASSVGMVLYDAMPAEQWFSVLGYARARSIRASV